MKTRKMSEICSKLTMKTAERRPNRKGAIRNIAIELS